MVNPVGSLEIIGTIDVASIKAGLSQVKSGLDIAKESAKSAFGDMEGLMNTLSGVGLKLVGIGAAAGAAIVGLAAIGPATAPALARMQVSFFELSRTVSEALAPAFDLAADAFENFVNFVNSPEGKGILEGLNALLVGGIKQTESFVETFSIGMGSIFKQLSGGKSDVDGAAASFKYFSDVLAMSGYIIEWVFVNAAIGLSGIIAFFQLAVSGFEAGVLGVKLSIDLLDKYTKEFFGQEVPSDLIDSINKAQNRLIEIGKQQEMVSSGFWSSVGDSRQYMGDKWDTLVSQIRTPAPSSSVTGPGAYNSEYAWNKEMND